MIRIITDIQVHSIGECFIDATGYLNDNWLL